MKLKTMLLSSAALLMLAGCTADDLLGENNSSNVPISLTASVEEDDAATRASTSLLSTSFVSGDVFKAYFPSNVTVSSTTSGSSTTFTYNGTQWTPATQPYFNAGSSSTTVHAYYPSTVTNSTTSFSVQTGQNTDANYKKSDLMYATATIQKSSPTGSLTFKHKMAKIIVSATPGSGVTNITAIKIVGGYRTINISTPQTCTLGSTLSDANSSTNITMYSGTSSSTFSCAALIPPQTINGSFLQIATNKGTVTYSLSSKALASANSYTFNITVNAAAIGTTVAITNWNNNGSVTVNPTVETGGVVAVDLGLGVKWASMNVGASCETDYGMYFQWGDIIGYSPAIIISGTTTAAADGHAFSWSTYKWGTSSSNLTKYNSTDGKTQLDLADDAARANWGGNWRMPTYDEINNLKATKSNTTDYTWIWCNGSTTKYNNSTVTGWKITYNATGATIFLPAAGNRSNTKFFYQGTNGYYWSSSLYTANPSSAKFSGFDSDDVSVSNGSRSNGLAVRPVQ